MNNRLMSHQTHVFASAYLQVRLLQTWFLVVALIAAAAVLTTPAALAQTDASAASPYRYTSPLGWTRNFDGAAETFTVAAEPQSNVQIMLVAPKPLVGDFNAQFAEERAALESFWGLRAPQPAAPQNGVVEAGPYAAYFSSYDSDAGQRYMSFLALGQQGQFGMVIFVTSTSEDFNRLAPVASQLFSDLAIIGAGR